MEHIFSVSTPPRQMRPLPRTLNTNTPTRARSPATPPRVFQDGAFASASKRAPRPHGSSTASGNDPSDVPPLLALYPSLMPSVSSPRASPICRRKAVASEPTFERRRMSSVPSLDNRRNIRDPSSLLRVSHTTVLANGCKLADSSSSSSLGSSLPGRSSRRASTGVLPSASADADRRPCSPSSLLPSARGDADDAWRPSSLLLQQFPSLQPHRMNRSWVPQPRRPPMSLAPHARDEATIVKPRTTSSSLQCTTSSSRLSRTTSPSRLPRASSSSRLPPHPPSFYMSSSQGHSRSGHRFGERDENLSTSSSQRGRCRLNEFTVCPSNSCQHRVRSTTQQQRTFSDIRTSCDFVHHCSVTQLLFSSRSTSHSASDSDSLFRRRVTSQRFEVQRHTMFGGFLGFCGFKPFSGGKSQAWCMRPCVALSAHRFHMQHAVSYR